MQILLSRCTRKFGWGWDKFLAEANTGKGRKMQNWMRGYMTWMLPVVIVALFIIGIWQFFR